MLVNAFLFDMGDPDNPKLVMVQKTDQGNKWALPGGRGRENETNPLDVCGREVAEEVYPEAADAILKNWIEEIEIDRGKYKQHIFLAPFSGKLRKKGLKEKDAGGNFVERLGPPTWVSFNDVRRGIVTVGKQYYDIYASHMNAIHEAFSSMAEIYPELEPIAKETERFAWDKG